MRHNAIPSRHTYRMGKGPSQSDVSFPRLSDKRDSFSATYSNLLSSNGPEYELS